MTELALSTEGCAVTRTDELKQLMKSYFCPPEWALFFEVYASTGGAGGRTDAVAINTYPSRGLLIHGFEMKVSRADWLRELKEPAKAEEMFGCCDHWWLVVGDRSIVKPGELPEPWGLMAPRSNGILAIVTRAQKLKPKPLDRGLIASLARRANEMATESIEDRVAFDTKILTGERDEARRERDELRRIDRQHLMKQVAAFEQASGIKIADRWSHGDQIGKIVKAVLEHGQLADQRHGVTFALKQLESITKNLKQFLDSLPKEANG